MEVLVNYETTRRLKLVSFMQSGWVGLNDFAGLLVSVLEPHSRFVLQINGEISEGTAGMCWKLCVRLGDYAHIRKGMHSSAQQFYEKISTIIFTAGRCCYIHDRLSGCEEVMYV